MSDLVSSLDRRAALTRALKRYHSRLSRKVEALRDDLSEARRAPEFRVFGEPLLAYLRQVPARQSIVALPDPANASRNLEIPLDPAIAPQANAARYFKRAAKAERGLKEIPPRLSGVEAEAHALFVLLERARALDESGHDTARPDASTLDRDLESALARVPASVARTLGVSSRPAATGPARGPSRSREDIPARLQPRRLKTREGWDVLIGRSNEGNDY